jgi:drug/metabolite transporter (DMT)-like permease
MPHTAKEEMVRGPLLLMAGIGLFGLLDANSKLLAGDFAAAQAVFLRHAVLLGLLLALRGSFGWPGGPLLTTHPLLHGVRACTMLTAGLSFYVAVRYLSLADAYLIFFTAPFMTLLLARVFLKERVPRAAWLWSGVGFSGVMIALAPQLGEGGSLLGFSCALLGTVAYALNITLNRSLRAEPGIARLVFWPSLFGVLATGPFAAWHWAAPSAIEWVQLLLNGVLAGGATILLALALRHGSPARLAPGELIARPHSVTLDLLIFGNRPGIEVFLGGAVVVLACVMSERAVLRVRQGISAGKR